MGSGDPQSNRYWQEQSSDEPKLFMREVLRTVKPMTNWWIRYPTSHDQPAASETSEGFDDLSESESKQPV